MFEIAAEYRFHRGTRQAGRTVISASKDTAAPESARSGETPARRLRLSAQDRFIDWFQSAAP
ncbi:MAG TPA: hypothetical protein VFG44_08345, partial [Burkholderiales bacterium]|nr:hypothetical protein [Burkholderiales bacterium]